MPETCENWLGFVNSYVCYTRQIREIGQVLPYSVDFKALAKLWNPLSETVPSKCSYTPGTTKLLGGILVSLRPSVCPFVRPSRLPCPLCNIYSSGWILSILATNDHYHEKVCRTQWPLTLTYIFKVIQPWLRKPCRLCSVYSSQWILFIFGRNNHYH